MCTLWIGNKKCGRSLFIRQFMAGTWEHDQQKSSGQFSPCSPVTPVGFTCVIELNGVFSGSSLGVSFPNVVRAFHCNYGR